MVSDDEEINEGVEVEKRAMGAASASAVSPG
jgi:hypothetical protein